LPVGVSIMHILIKPDINQKRMLFVISALTKLNYRLPDSQAYYVMLFQDIMAALIKDMPG